jgi:3-oxoadipate enol-lactonase
MPTATISDIEIHYDSTGSGPAVLLIHGLGSSGRDWEYQLPALTGYRVIMPDLRGHGLSAKPKGRYTIAGFAADMAGLMRELGTGPAHIVGLSLGGAIAFQLAVDAPELVRSLTIINSAPDIVPRNWRQRFMISQRLALIRFVGLKRFSVILAGRLFPEAGQAGLRRMFVERFKANRKGPYLSSLRALIGWSVASRLGDIRVPVLVVAADQDYTPVSFKEDYTAKLPKGRLAVVRNSRHATPVDQPEALNRLLVEFLGSMA